MDTKTTSLNNFISQVVDGWMLRDLDTLTAIPLRPGEAGNCNFPIALYTFSCIEFLGQLTFSGTLSPNGYTRDSVLGFINDFFPDDFKQKLQPHEKEFVNIFRNGLAHNYFAKAAGVSRTKTEPFSMEDGHLVLDADRFVDAFLLAVNKLKTTIQNDTQLVERMVDKYETQVNENQKFKLSADKISFYSTSSSGASLAHPSMLQDLKPMKLPSTTTTSSSSSSKQPGQSSLTTTLPPELNKKK
jgi:hypothetical protein